MAGIHLARVLKSLPSQFSSAGLVEAQGTAVSADGTPVPYFIVHQAGVALDGSTPTLLYGYGGFGEQQHKFFFIGYVYRG